MTATDQMRAMLDQLMGTSRNGEFFACDCVIGDSMHMDAQLAEKKSLCSFLIRVQETGHWHWYVYSII